MNTLNSNDPADLSEANSLMLRTIGTITISIAALFVAWLTHLPFG